ncbi:general substrate transporter [Trematosphaeria pertusa]|uniref:General substrate transporter n=1 Tax=Trematosphaeria pertusa TaxID=390896 RepID=A0A6A6IQQ9_9PLEO|nr:general substrate transporter [Trematosphaeria pertusa]KAF2252884.1 general substrate transporter [Trematosphaeria pertusa]
MAEGKISKLVPRNQKALLACIILTSVIDSVLVGYDSSLMGSFNVMPSYISYFTLTTTTKSLNTAISYMGGAVMALFAGPLTDWRGRKECIFWSAVVTLIGGVVQGAAQNVGMFIAGRFVVGFGLGLSQVATPTLVAETAPVQWRGFALGLYYACWGVGTLMASGICYGAAPSLFCMVILFFIPESPRWLVSRGRHQEALQVLAIANTGGDTSSPIVQVQFKEITDTLRWEKERELSVVQALAQPANRRRLLITSTFSIMVMLPGTNIVTFYFGDMLSSAGISDPTTQLQINVILTSWTFVVAVVASFFADKLGRKTLCILSLSAGVVALYILAGLTAVYGNSGYKPGVYGTIAMIFIYNATYAWGITPLTVLYPPEVLSFDIRAVGMGIYTFTTKLCGLFVTMVVPFGLSAISWKVYIINASVDILMVSFVVFVWVETRGLTLEEVDVIFDGVKHSDVPDLEAVKEGKKLDLDVFEGQAVAQQRVEVNESKA